MRAPMRIVKARSVRRNTRSRVIAFTPSRTKYNRYARKSGTRQQVHRPDAHQREEQDEAYQAQKLHDQISSTFSSVMWGTLPETATQCHFAWRRGIRGIARLKFIDSSRDRRICSS